MAILCNDADLGLDFAANETKSVWAFVSNGSAMAIPAHTIHIRCVMGCVYLGNSTTGIGGMSLGAGELITIPLSALDELFATSDNCDSRIYVMAVV